MTQSELISNIDKLDSLLDKLSSHNSDSRKLWQLRKEIFLGFKETRFEKLYFHFRSSQNKKHIIQKTKYGYNRT